MIVEFGFVDLEFGMSPPNPAEVTDVWSLVAGVGFITCGCEEGWFARDELKLGGAAG